MLASVIGKDEHLEFYHSVYDDIIRIFEIPDDNIADFGGKTIWYMGYLLGNEELFNKIIKGLGFRVFAAATCGGAGAGVVAAASTAAASTAAASRQGCDAAAVAAGRVEDFITFIYENNEEWVCVS
tara:strand:- start:2344 stop:2721 length:378 start_codon:yes stop_codon:yes gene_type:complete